MISRSATNPLSSHLQMQEKMITEAMANAMYSHPSFVMFIFVVVLSLSIKHTYAIVLAVPPSGPR